MIIKEQYRFMMKVQHSRLSEKDLSETELAIFNSLYDDYVTVCYEDGDSYLVLTYLGIAECRNHFSSRVMRFVEVIGVIAAITAAVLSGIAVYGATTL